MSNQASKTVRLWLELWKSLPGTDRRRLGVAAITMIISSIATAILPLIVGSFVDAVFAGGRMGTLEGSLRPLAYLVAALLAISVMELVRHQLVHSVTTSFQAEARLDMYKALIRWDLARYTEDLRGTIYGRANRSVEGAEKLIKLGASDLLPALLVSVFAIALAIYRYGWIGAVMAIVVPTGLGIVLWQIRSQHGIRVQVLQAKGRIDGYVASVLSMLDVIRTSGTEGFFDAKVKNEVEQLRKRELRHHVAMSKFDMAKALNEAAWLIVTLVVIFQSRSFGTPGDLAGAVMLYIAITRPLRDLHRIFDEASESSIQATHLVEDLRSPWDVAYATPTSASPVVDASIIANDLRFSYPGKPPVLKGVNLIIPSGQRVGLVGAAGCGKSTILKLLARLEHGADGQLLIGHKSIDQLARDELVREVGYVPQNARLFQGTIRENLTMGREITEADLIQACERANILTTIEQMPGKFDSIVAEDGANLSGGQRQRMCLARALVRTPPVLLLDEPTSALDSPNQAAVQAAIDQLTNVTMVIVAHRLSTLKNVDRIVVLDGGLVVEDGTFHSLAQIPNGRFAAMLRHEETGRDEPRLGAIPQTGDESRIGDDVWQGDEDAVDDRIGEPTEGARR